MTIDPQSLRESPQLAALELLVQAAETATVALCAAHPNIEHDLRHVPEPPIERLADHLIDRATVRGSDSVRSLLGSIRGYLEPVLQREFSPCLEHRRRQD